MQKYIQMGLAITLLLQSTWVSAVPSYQVGAGDELAIDLPMTGNVADLSKLSGNGLSIQIVSGNVFWRSFVTVAPDGYIVIPTLLPISADGLSLLQIRDRISEQLKGQKTQISVELKRPVSHAYFVWGEVKNPGRYVYERPTSVLEGISVAGGPTDRAKLKKVLLVRNGQTAKALDLSIGGFDPSVANDSQVRPLDTIIVPKKHTPDSNTLFLWISAIAALTGVYVATK